PLCALTVSMMVAWSAGCTLFRTHKAPAAPLHTRQAPPRAASVTRLPLRIIHSAPTRSAPTRSAPTRSVPVSISKPSQPQLNMPQRLAPAPLVTLENSDDAKANAQRSLDQATLKMTRINRAELAESTASTYQQAND